METQSLIHKLAGELRAKKPPSLERAAGLTFLSLSILIGVQLLLRPLRPDAMSVVMAPAFFFLAAGLFSGAQLLALGLALSGVPGRTGAKVYYSVAIAAFLAGVNGLFFFPLTPSTGELWSELGGLGCIEEALLLSLLPAAAIFFLLRRRAFTKPGRAGAIVGVLCVAGSALALTLCCTSSHSLHVSACHFILPAIFSSIIGGLVGRALLRW